MPVPDHLIAALRRCSQTLPDGRRGKNTTYSMSDFVLAAFAPFFMQSPSFLAHQRFLETGQGRNNCQTLFGVDRIPCDNQVRAMLDPVEPTHFYPMFADIMAELQQSGGLDAMRWLDGHMLIALDGTEYHGSQDVHCPNCSHRKRGKEKVEYFHTMLAATVVAPGHNRAVPLEPEFIVPQDGHEKQDCESRAARRWLAAHGAQYRRFDPVYLGDDLFSRQPICEAVLAEGGHFLFVCKPDSHPAIEEFRAGIALDALNVRTRRGKKWMTYRYQWLCDVPLRGDAEAITVNWFSIEISDDQGMLNYRNSFITDMAVGRDNAADMAAAGRARWKVENAAFNTLKTKGYNLEHNFGHGQQHLSSVLATLNLLAFACHTVCDLADPPWRAARRQLVTRQGFFQTIVALTKYWVFPSWDNLLATMAFARPPPLAP
ncbi:MAG: hypothetical protein QOD93_5159 [Acetobacteraceae bacterium]|nr:hypothetical protein [Acetobacteraceae bacterium]